MQEERSERRLERGQRKGVHRDNLVAVRDERKIRLIGGEGQDVQPLEL